jgi:hypothetical protein
MEPELLLRSPLVLVKNNGERGHSSSRFVNTEAACPAPRTSPKPR